MSKVSRLLILVLIVLPIMGCSSSAEFPVGRYGGGHQGWVLEFEEDGTWKGYREGELFTVGTYSVSGNEITWEMDSECLDEPATYTWTKDGDSLTFHLEGQDPCDGRVTVLDGVTYTRIP